MMVGLRTRPATAGDKDFVWSVLKQAFRPYITQVWGWDEAKLAAQFEAEYDWSLTDIVVYQGEDVGYLRVEDHGDRLFLDTIAILPAYQGCGIGSSLVRQVLRRAARRGLPVRLRVLRINPARNLYERLGFHLVGGDEIRYFMEAAPFAGQESGRSVPDG